MLPLLSGGRTTPNERVELSGGGAARIPLGDLDQASGVLRDAVPGGVAPLVAARYGVTDHWDLGIMASPSAWRIDVRREVLLDADSSLRPTLLFTASPHVGLAEDSIGLVGGELSALLTLDATSVIELWTGLRLGTTHAWTDVPTGTTNATGVRAGFTLGLATGFRHLHALAELTVDYEAWSGDTPAGRFTASGLSLTPAFALRLRL